MAEKMDRQLCDDRKENVDNELKRHENWLLRHDDEIGAIKVVEGRQAEAIDGLKGAIKNLNNTIKWGVGLGLTAMIGLMTLIFQLINILE